MEQEEILVVLTASDKDARKTFCTSTNTWLRLDGP